MDKVKMGGLIFMRTVVNLRDRGEGINVDGRVVVVNRIPRWKIWGSVTCRGEYDMY